jgi:hypothetical protein
MLRNNPFTLASVVTLKELDYEKALKLKEFLDDLTGYSSDLRRKYDDDLLVKFQARRDDNDKRKKREAELDKLITLWINGGHLTAGMVVKMKGCRNGRGLRQVLSIKNGMVECRQIIIRRFPAPHGYYSRVEESLGQITTHLSNKIQSVKVDGGFIPIREIVEAYRDKLDRDRKHDEAREAARKEIDPNE